MPGFIMAGRIQAAFFVVVSTLISLAFPPMVVLSNAAIALITLRKGWQQGIVYALIATATLVIISVVKNLDAFNGVIAGVVTWLPIVLITSILAITSSWTKTLQLILLITVIGVLLFHMLYPDAAAFWIQLLEPIKPLLKAGYGFSDAKIDEVINNSSQWMTGTFAAALALITIISLIMARSWQARLYNPGGFGEEFRQIQLGKQVTIGLLAATAIAVLTDNQLIIEIIMVAIAIFMFQGLSLVHSIVNQRGMSDGWLIAFYILMFLLLIQMIVLLATLGIIDNFVNFRQKYSSNNKT